LEQEQRDEWARQEPERHPGDILLDIAHIAPILALKLANEEGFNSPAGPVIAVMREGLQKYHCPACAEQILGTVEVYPFDHERKPGNLDQLICS